MLHAKTSPKHGINFFPYVASVLKKLMWKIRYLLFSIFVGMLYSQALDIKYTIVFVHKDNFIIVCVGELFKILRMRMLTKYTKVRIKKLLYF